MAPQVKDSISTIVNRNETYRNSTRDFLIDASRLIAKHHDNNNGLNRYYQLRINSLINTDETNVDYLLKLSSLKSTNCVKCGNKKDIKLITRKKLNKSKERKYCKYLHSILEEYCDKCHCFRKTYKLNPPNKKHSYNSGETSFQKKDNTCLTRPKTTRNKHIQQKQKQHLAAPVLKSSQNKNQPKKTKLKEAKYQSKPPARPVPKPQFSSRLRAFSCLLKE